MTDGSRRHFSCPLPQWFGLVRGAATVRTHSPCRASRCSSSSWPVGRCSCSCGTTTKRPTPPTSRNPLDFANGPYSARGIEQRVKNKVDARAHPGEGNLPAAASLYLHAVQANFGEKRW